MCVYVVFFFFFNDTATTEIYTLSLHDALPILSAVPGKRLDPARGFVCGQILLASTAFLSTWWLGAFRIRSEEHTSELQSHSDLVCRLLLEKKKKLLPPSTPT